MLNQIASYLDADSYAHFRQSCAAVRSALPSPRDIDQRIRRKQTRNADLYRLSAQGRFSLLLAQCNPNFQYSLEHSRHRWTSNVVSWNSVSFAFALAHHDWHVDDRDHALIENVLNRIADDLKHNHGAPDQGRVCQLYSHFGAPGFSRNYAHHTLAIDKTRMDSSLLATLLATIDGIVQQGPTGEKLVATAILAHLLAALKSQPDVAPVLNRNLKVLLGRYPETMYLARAFAQWRGHI